MAMGVVHEKVSPYRIPKNGFRRNERERDKMTNKPLTCVEICTGAGGQALGLEQAGFRHVALLEIEPQYCEMLRKNKPKWNVICGDVASFSGFEYEGVDLFAGGVPCPPFSHAGKQLGAADERDLFPQALRLVEEIKPRAVMLENVRGFLDPVFDDYRQSILARLDKLGYNPSISLVRSSDYGVSQLRPRTIIVGISKEIESEFHFPTPHKKAPISVGKKLYDLMAQNGWEGADEWRRGANKIAPTLVGGSKKHGGPDLGPSRARKAWEELGVDGRGVADEAPLPGFKGNPRLTPRMMARIQGFPDYWDFGKGKTVACRMIGNAFPPPVAKAIGRQIKECLRNG